jgi:deazaflavin-dependent oxidoreductase (nitroreductase family)
MSGGAVANVPGVDKAWPVLNRLMAGHAAIYKATNGRIGHRVPGLPPMLLLDHVGAKSGVKRTSPLLYIEDGDDIVIVASKGGYPQHPAWFHNLRANPDTEVQVGRERRRVHARVASAEERSRLWPKAVDAYSSYADYQRKAPREIPMVILERRP